MKLPFKPMKSKHNINIKQVGQSHRWQKAISKLKYKKEEIHVKSL